MSESLDITVALFGLFGAIIGSLSTCFITYYTLQKQQEQKIWDKKFERIDLANRDFLLPLLDCIYSINVRKNVNDLDTLVTSLRNGRKFFIYYPEELKNPLFSIYLKIETMIKEDENNWKSIFFRDMPDELASLENVIYDTLKEMRF
jgi:hypothetical protein